MVVVVLVAEAMTMPVKVADDVIKYLRNDNAGYLSLLAGFNRV